MAIKACCMDDLLREFLTETNESLDVVDVELVRFEQDPNNAQILGNIFRLVHTIKGTCGFLGLPRLAALAHAAETLMGRFRDGVPVTAEAVTIILASIDRIKSILDYLEQNQREPDGLDADLIGDLDRMVGQRAASPGHAVGSLVYQVLERPLRPGEVSLDELERVFRDTPGPASIPAAKITEREDEDKPEGKAANRSIRVNLDTLEHLMTMVSELVLTRNHLLEMARQQEESEFKAPLQRLSNVTAELQESVMKTRMQPIGIAWQKLPRIIRDLAAELDKQIEFEMHGVDTELDRQVLELIRDPLTHMVRNSADHGLETTAGRIAAGKSEKGTIRLSAYHEGGHVVIGVADDGRGLNTEKIKAKAIARGLATQAEIDKMSETQVHRFIFAPGFSTAEKITNISGRGVGMDVVHTNIDQIGGSIEVKSVAGEGASFTLRIPLTLAIISALIVEEGEECFAIPQLSVVELVRVGSNSEHRIERIKEAPVLRLRNKLLPLFSLGSAIAGGAREDDAAWQGFVVVMQVGNQVFGLLVDGILQTEEIVVKPMSTKLRHIRMFAGNTILGDGSVIMIIDPNGIAEVFGSTLASLANSAHERARAAELSAANENKLSLLVFRAGSPQPKAVPLSLVTRLEEIDGRQIELSNGRHLVQYRGQLMPLVRVNGDVRIKDEGAQQLLVFSDGGRSMALVVDEIVDIVEDNLDIQVGSESPGILGSAVIKGDATEIIDLAHFLPLAFSDWFRGLDLRAPAGRNLLFVDDSAFFRNMLLPVLKAAGYEVAAVGGARDALSLLKSGRHFDVVVTDLDMPEMDGFDLAAAIKADDRTAGLPLIALSSVPSQELIARVRQARFHDCVAKFDRQGLIAALKEQTAGITEAA
jgi:two-component system chemotaxis sensor kinase CheA